MLLSVLLQREGVNKLKIKQLDMLREGERREFQHMIDYMKESIGEGSIIESSFIRICKSPLGFWCEAIPIPEEFTAVVCNQVIYQNLSRSEAFDLVKKVDKLLQEISFSNTTDFSMFCAYGPDIYDRENQFAFSLSGDLSFGKLKLDTLPLFMKMKYKSDLFGQFFGQSQGVAILIPDIAERNLLVKFPTQDDIDLTQGSHTIH